MSSKNSSTSETLDIAGLHAALSSGGDLEKSQAQNRAAAERMQAIDFIRKNRTSQWDETVAGKIEKTLALVEENFPEALPEARRLVNEGKKIEELFDKARKAGIAKNEKALKGLEMQLEPFHPTEAEKKRLRNKFEQGAKKAKAIRENRLADIHIPGPDYDPAGPNPHFLGKLAPSRHWFVAMDETNPDYSSKAVRKEGGTTPGKYVAVLVPEESNLPRLSGGDHVMESSDARAAELLSALYAAQPRCGILGVTLDGMAAVSDYAHVNYWYNLIERTIDMVLRLVKLSETETTRLTFLVEARVGGNGTGGGKASADMVERALHDCLYRLAKADPERERRIRAEIFVESKKKTKNKDFIAYNGYADALAAAWNETACKREIGRSLRAHGLLGKCLLSGLGQDLPEILDAVHQGIPLRPDAWSKAVATARADGPDSATGILLREFGAVVRKKPSLWRNYLDETQRHLDSHAIDLRVLGTQISWLTAFMPKDATLPPRLELLWLTVRLAHANHLGATEEQMKAARIDMARFRKLVSDLYEEDAPLACWATLHLAVQATDAFDFARARRLVRDFLSTGVAKQERRGFFARIASRIAGSAAEDRIPAANPSVMGLRYYSQLLSSLGQHAAFEGDNESAVDFFRQAISGFSKLLEEKERKLEIDQTSAYLATAAMDSRDVPDSELSRTMRDYLGADPAEVAPTLASSTDPALKYHHHVLLRYIVSGRAPQAVADAYLSCRKKWAHGDDGHPWELIEFYRALLVDRPEEKAELLSRGLADINGGGPTLWVIGCVVLNALADFDPSARDTLRRYLDEIRTALPALGAKRLAALERAAKSPVPPLDLAKSVLPFNFR